MSRRKWKVDPEELREWLDGNGAEYLLTDAAKSAEKEFQSKRPRVAVFAGTLGDLGTYYSSLAAYRILTGKAEAWPEFKFAMRLFTASAGTYLELYAEKRFPHLSLVEPIEAMTASMALRVDEFTQWCYGKLKASLATGLFGNYWSMSPYFPFVLALTARLQKDELSLQGPGISPLMEFQAIFDNWDDPDGLDRAILTICDFHVDHVLLDHTPQEFFRPFDDWPAEILSLARVRNELGLATPQVNHPLLNTPLFQMPQQIPRFDGDIPQRALIERMLAFIHQDVPSLAGARFMNVFE